MVISPHLTLSHEKGTPQTPNASFLCSPGCTVLTFNSAVHWASMPGHMLSKDTACDTITAHTYYLTHSRHSTVYRDDKEIRSLLWYPLWSKSNSIIKVTWWRYCDKSPGKDREKESDGAPDLMKLMCKGRKNTKCKPTEDDKGSSHNPVPGIQAQKEIAISKEKDKRKSIQSLGSRPKRKLQSAKRRTKGSRCQ